MKKITTILATLLVIAITSVAQIPNNGFENWSTYGNGMIPDGWWSSNDSVSSSGTYFPVTRSTDHFPSNVGNYSICLTNNLSLLPGWEAIGLAWPGEWSGNDYPAFPIIGHPLSLCGYYKFLPQNNDSMRIFICLYENGVDVAQASLIDNTTASEWTSFSIPIPGYSNADSARIMLSSFNCDNGFNIQGNSVLFIDNLSFDTLINSVATHNSMNKLFNLYPNPASDMVTLNIDNRNNNELKLNIYNDIGLLVKSEILNQNKHQISIGELSNGIYLFTIISGDLIENQRLIIQK